MILKHWRSVDNCWHAHDREPGAEESTSLCGDDHWVGGETKTPGAAPCSKCFNALVRRVNGEPDLLDRLREQLR